MDTEQVKASYKVASQQQNLKCALGANDDYQQSDFYKVVVSLKRTVSDGG